ncbi:MAG TPA: hypothetical protein VGB87_17025 [Vicinamibacteria bacterium]
MLTIGAILLSSAFSTAPRVPRLAAAPPPPRACVAVRVASPQAPGARRASFSASKVVDLRIETFFARRLRGPRRLELRVFTPKGFLYQRLSVPFDATPPPDERGSPRLSMRSVGVRLPVAGTAITTNSLYGTWRVVPFLDDEAEPCGRERAFGISQ